MDGLPTSSFVPFPASIPFLDVLALSIIWRSVTRLTNILDITDMDSYSYNNNNNNNNITNNIIHNFVNNTNNTNHTSSTSRTRITSITNIIGSITSSRSNSSATWLRLFLRLLRHQCPYWHNHPSPRPYPHLGVGGGPKVGGGAARLDTVCQHTCESKDVRQAQQSHTYTKDRDTKRGGEGGTGRQGDREQASHKDHDQQPCSLIIRDENICIRFCFQVVPGCVLILSLRLPILGC